MMTTTKPSAENSDHMNRPQETMTYHPRQVRDLKKLVALGEGSRLEFKRKAAYPDKIVREMIAFANANGGTLLLGVGDDGTLSGLKHPDDESHVIRMSLKKCHPRLPVTEIIIPIGPSKFVLRYDVADSEHKPHYFRDGATRQSYIRVNDQSIKASREVREIARRAKLNKDIRFHYGEHEKFLMTYLDMNPAITLKEFMNVSGLKRFYASKKLVLLVLANVLRITPHEKGDLFSLAFGNQSGQ